MKFTKMHGLGNDYIYVDGAAEEIFEPSRLARRLSDRHKGIGGDGLIIIHPPSNSGVAGRMEMYNADGSRAQMCGNGIRCMAKYLLDRGRAEGPELVLETDAGPRLLRVISRDRHGRAEAIEVDMGTPRFLRSQVPMRDGGPPDAPAVDVPLPVEIPLRGGKHSLIVTGVSMGNPHCVVRLSGMDPFGAALGDLDLPAIGPALERHPAFPERANVEFIEPRNRGEIDFRVWERGSGETQACGTGACAAVVACVLGGLCDRTVRVHLLGGDLDIRWDKATDRVFMTGPTCEVFHGEVGQEWLEAGD